VYERFVPLLAGAPNNPRPITHIVTGPTGGEVRGTRDDSLLAKHYSGYNFVVVIVNGPRLTGRAVDVKGQALDTFAFSQQGGVYDARYMAQAVSRRREGGPVEAIAGGYARAPGRFGRAYQFDPWGAMLAVKPARPFNDKRGTIEFWVQGAYGSEWIHIASDSPAASHHRLYRTRLAEKVIGGVTNKVYGVVYETAVANVTNRVFVPLVSSNWNHIVARYDAETGGMGLSVNGGREVTARYRKTTCANARVIGVGGLADRAIGLSGHAFGYIDEVRVSSALRRRGLQRKPYQPDDATVTLLHFDETNSDWPGDAANPWQPDGSESASHSLTPPR
jgi:hypothetical protein